MHILLLLTNLWFSPIPLNYSVDQMTVIIRGRVVNEETHSGMAGAHVMIMSEFQVRETTSDRNGNYLFLALMPGTYKVCVSGVQGYAAGCGKEQELSAGFEYGAMSILSRELN